VDLSRYQTWHSWARLHFEPKHMWIWRDARSNPFWAWLRAEHKCLWIWRDVRPNTLGLNYVLNSNTCESVNMPNLTLLGPATCEAQVSMSMTRYQAQHSWDQLRVKPKHMWIWRDTRFNPFWAWLRAEHKCLWIWKDVRPNALRLNYMLNSNTCRSGMMRDPIPWGSGKMSDQKSLGFTLAPSVCGSDTMINIRIVISLHL
jgi:hypothetical protein